jgi:hypothetical protein
MSLKVSCRLLLVIPSLEAHARQVEIETWVAALQAYEAQEFDRALR